ncbi:MAG: M20/M25/M40 family metallo-hydrolase [Bacteroidetes bacterium]|nr:M20/M25/M40 family metallo-hydrolase [Bacteroidota bacterium]
MKHIFCRLIIAMLAIIPTISMAQAEKACLVEKCPDPSAPVTRFSETAYARQLHARDNDPVITAMVSAINTDTLRSTLRYLQNRGSRFLMRDDNKELTTSLMNKFLSYGYTDVKLDSFYLAIPNWNGLSDSAWQYNVVCTLAGNSAPGEIYVVGGHYDSFCQPDPMNNAPGVNDNGTAVAATCEIARVMKLLNYRPEATIQFTLFGAEELGLFGSRAAAYQARLSGTDIRYMLNLDMISNNPSDSAAVKVYQYIGFEWAGLAAAAATERYTDLSVVFPPNHTNSGSDSFPYWAYGFPSAYFEEIFFSPNWHIPSDTLGNCNIPYLKKVTGGALATLAEQQALPYPQSLWAESSKEKITLHWMPTGNDFVRGFNIYRSETAGTGFQKINAAPVADSIFHDVPGTLNKQYYYVISTVNNDQAESPYSNEVYGARFNFCDSLLVLANMKGNKTTPDSVLAFYKAVLDTIPYKWIDINAVQKVNLSVLSRYRSILWMSNSLEFESPTEEMVFGTYQFVQNGGNLLFAGLSPSHFWINGSFNYPLYIPENTIIHNLFKIDSVDRKTQSMLFRANAVAPGYDTLRIDSLKYMDKNFPGQLYTIDVFSPDPAATVVYRFDSKFDSTTSFGKMKHRPVGIEYLGTDHKSILLSFPLYYLDTTDAHDFMHFVMTKKFGYPVGIPGVDLTEPFAMQVFPNPVQDACNITFTLDHPGRVRLTLVSLMGQTVSTWLDRKLERGTHRLHFSTAGMKPGMYEVLLQQGHETAVRKIVHLD